MALHIRNRKVENAVRQLARHRGVTLTEAVHIAALQLLEQHPLTALTPRSGLRDRVRKVQDDLARFSKTGLKADKAFYDSLSDQ